MSVKSDVAKLAKKECANHYGKDRCLLTGEQCVFFNNLANQTCKYAQESLLPGVPALEQAYYDSFRKTKTERKDIANCDICGNSFRKASNRQRFCHACREQAETEARRKRDSRYREAKRRIRKNNDASNA
jgi:hypothetical protein